MSAVISTADVPLASQRDYWQSTWTNAIVPCGIHSDTETELQARMSTGSVGALRVIDTTATPYEVVRTPKLIRRSDPEEYGFQLLTRGRILLTQDDREAILKPGDLSISESSRPFHFRGMSRRRVVHIAFPRTLLPFRHDEVARLTGTSIPGQTGVGALVSALLCQLAARLDDDDVADNVRLSVAVVDLIAAALAARLDRGAVLAPEIRRRALLLRIRAFIDDHLTDPALSPGDVAAAHHINSRYLRKLFEAHGETVTGRIRDQRLARCRRELLDPDLAGVPVAAIAARWGFTSSAHFTRVFRAAYGLPPGAYRSTHHQH